MAISLPGGPDPIKRRRVVRAPSSKKPKRPRTTTGNVYRSTPPPSSRKLATPAPAPRPVAPITSTGPAPPPNPYARFEGIPGAVDNLIGIDRAQNLHQDYVNKTVAPWLSAGLNGLAQFNKDAQNQYMGNVQGGAVGGAITPLGGQSAAPGGVVAGPNAYLTGAGQEYAQAQGSVAQQIAAYQGVMNKLQPTTLSQGYINSLADYAKGLPALYTERRSAYIDKLDGYLAQVAEAQAQAQADAQKLALDQAKFDEASRHNRVSESISATNASTNAAFQASRLGLSAQDQAFDQQGRLISASSPAPAGYVSVPDGRGGAKFVRDPNVPQATASGGSGSTAPSASRGQYVPNKLRKEGFVGGWKVKPKGVKGPFVRATDGTYWRKPGSSSTGSTPKTKAGSSGFDIQKDLTYSIEKDYIDDTDQAKAVPQLVRFLRKHQPSTPATFNKWWSETASILKEQNPDLAIWMANYITRRQRDKSWKGLF